MRSNLSRNKKEEEEEEEEDTDYSLLLSTAIWKENA